MMTTSMIVWVALTILTGEVLGNWIIRRFIDKQIRVKVDDVEIEARSTDEVIELLNIAQILKTASGAER